MKGNYIIAYNYKVTIFIWLFNVCIRIVYVTNKLNAFAICAINCTKIKLRCYTHLNLHPPKYYFTPDSRHIRH